MWHSTNSVEALKKTQSIDPKQWPGLIFSSSTTRRLMEEAFASFRPALQHNTNTVANCDKTIHIKLHINKICLMFLLHSN